MNKLWKSLFFLTWIVIIFLLFYVTYALGEAEKVTNQYITRGNGDSAYEIAVKNGFEGSELEWLSSLNGKDGIGRDGRDSVSTNTTTKIHTEVIKEVPAKSAYDIWLEQGNTGTVDEYLDSLRGKDAQPITTMIRLNEDTGKLQTKLSTDKFWKNIPSCGISIAKECN